MQTSLTAKTSPALLQRLRRQLLVWFRRHQRELPWRATRDPYPIWVSEVMLQQTQVATVIPYFERFMAAFPTIAALAAAPEEAVLRLWEGLGYYRRARHLHQAAQMIVREHGGQFPCDFDRARRLPGLGRYSVGAILSQAFEARLPIVEANSRRVLCRVFGYRGDPRSGEGERWLWRTAEGVLPRRNVGDFNQALMELGALVCVPTAPRCLICPLARDCVARQQGLQEQIPPRPAAPDLVEIEEVAGIIRRGERVFVVQRPTEAKRWANFWEFPHGPVAAAEAASRARTLLHELTGLTVEVREQLQLVRHGVTRHRIQMACFAARYQSGRFRSDFYQRGRWVKPAELAELPFSAPQRRLAEDLFGDAARSARDAAKASR